MAHDRQQTRRRTESDEVDRQHVPRREEIAETPGEVRINQSPAAWEEHGSSGLDAMMHDVQRAEPRRDEQRDDTSRK